jgi:outer membrane protein
VGLFLRVVACGLLGALVVDQSLAQAPPESPWRFGVAVGYGQRSNPLIQSKSIPVVVDVDVAWFGKRWFFDNGDLGFTFVDRAAVTANMVARVNSDRTFFAKTSTRFVQVSATGAALAAPVELKPPRRDYAVELGLEAITNGDWGQATFSVFQDVSATHGGVELATDYTYRWNRGRFSLAPSVGLRFKSASMNDYYWGIRANEASIALPAYKTGSGVNVRTAVRAGYYFTRRLHLAGSVSYEKLDHSISASPLVKESNVVGYFGGLAYQF